RERSSHIVKLPGNDFHFFRTMLRRSCILPPRGKFADRALNLEYRSKRNTAQPDQDGRDTQDQYHADAQADPIPNIIPAFRSAHGRTRLFDIDIDKTPQYGKSPVEVAVSVH